MNLEVYAIESDSCQQDRTGHISRQPTMNPKAGAVTALLDRRQRTIGFSEPMHLNGMVSLKVHVSGGRHRRSTTMHMLAHGHHSVRTVSWKLSFTSTLCRICGRMGIQYCFGEDLPIWLICLRNSNTSARSDRVTDRG